MVPKLTLKQRKFCLAFVGEANGNGVEAARLAGYKGVDLTLRVVASENLTKPNIQLFIAQLRADAESAASEKIMESHQVLIGLTRIANGDIAEVLGDGAPEWLKQAKAKGLSRLIKTINFDKDTGNVTKIEMYSSHEAQRDLGKYHGLFPTRITLTPEDADRLIDDAIREHGLPDGEQSSTESSGYPM